MTPHNVSVGALTRADIQVCSTVLYMQLSAMEMIQLGMETPSCSGVPAVSAADRNGQRTQANTTLFSTKQTDKPESRRHFSFSVKVR